MRVNGVILPTEPFVEWDASRPLAYEAVGKRNFLDYQVYEIRRLFKDPIILLGPDGDDLLRLSPKLAERKMVFSRNPPRTELEQILIGLSGTGTCGFFLPLHVPVPAPIVWSELEKALAQMPYQKGPHVLEPKYEGSSGYPLLITPRGKDWLEELDLAPDHGLGLFDLPGIEVQSVNIRSETALQELKSIEHFLEWKSLFAP